MPDERNSVWFEVEVYKMSENLVNKILCEFLKSAEGIASISLRHQKMNVWSWQTEIKVGLHQAQVRFIP